MYWRDHFNPYLAISAFHKEVRRGDFERAYSWAQILLRKRSPASIVGYILKIVFEETRNIHLWIRLQKKSLSFDQAVEQIVLSKKKWHLNGLNHPESHLLNWFAGLQKASAESKPTPLELPHLVSSIKDPVDCYSIYFHLKQDKTLRPYFLDLMKSLARQSKNELLQEYIELGPSGGYEIMVCLELVSGIYDPSSSDLGELNKLDAVFLPKHQLFYDDIHTSRGKKILSEGFNDCFRKRTFQNGSVDLRWSGSLWGCLFRELCFRQKGSMKNTLGEDWSWSEIVFNDRDFEAALALEKFYYPSFFKNGDQFNQQ
ncbi:MAG: hypothetical protein ABTQ25_14000 [Nitrosomonas ureae]